MEIVKDESTGYYHRPGTLDLFVFGEVKNIYGLTNISGQIVLDIGANIGAFAKLATQQGAKVVAFEPDKENFELVKLNSPTSININKAVVGNDDLQRTFYINNKKNKGAHSFHIKRGRTAVVVDCIKFQDILNTYTPDILKVDIEGGEFEIFDSIQFVPPSVKQIAIEIHLNKKQWKETMAPKLIEFLRREGFTPEVPIEIKSKGFFYTEVRVFRRC